MAKMAIAFSAEDEVLQSLQFLQTHVGLNTTSQRSHNETALAARGICVTDDKLTVKDLTYPVLEVMARYGEDGYCVFGNFSDCLSECALGRRARDPSYYPSWLTPIYSEILNRSWRLAQDIAAAPSAHAAWELLRSQANFDQIHVAACLHRMATQQASPPALQEISSPEFSARHLSNLLWSVARCRETEAKSLLEELPRQDMSPQGLANCFWAISKLQGDNLQVVDVLANEAKLRATQDLTSILWSASTFAVRFNDLIRVLAEHAAICAPQQSARQLTNAAWALATVSPEQMRKTVEIIVQKALQRGPLTRDLWLQHPTVGLIWALCVTRACAGPLLMAGVRTGRLSGGPAELSSVDVSRCVWAAAILESELPAAKQLVLQAAEVSLHDAATVVQAPRHAVMITMLV
eukprot:g23161.t1